MQTPSPRSHSRESRHLLAVLDEAGDRSLYPALPEVGYRVTLAGSALTPGDIRLLRPDVVLLDLTLGGGEKNWRLLRQLKEHPATAAIPVLVCLPALAPIPNGSGSHEGACGILRKPLDLEAFLRQTDLCAEPSDGT